MKKGLLIWIIIAASLICIGAVIIGISFINMKGDFNMLSTKKYETSTHNITDTFTDILISGSDADIYILPSEDNVCKVISYEFIRSRHSVTLDGSTLTIKEINERKWYDYIDINFKSPEIKIYLPEAQYNTLTIDVSTGKINIPNNFSFGDVNIKGSTGDISFSASARDINVRLSTGDITLNGLTANNVSLTVSTGKISITDLTASGDAFISVSTGKTFIQNTTAQSLTSKGTTGDISLKGVIVKEKLSAERSTGDVEFSRCDAGEIYIKTSTGDVEGTLLSAKHFITSSKTGDIEVPKTHEGGVCNVQTSTGDIEIYITK